VVLSTWSFGPVANAAAQPVLLAGGSALDAVVAAATAVENDPAIDSVGVGGMPDASGRLSLDACVMTDPNRCGSVAFIRRFANPAAIARRVMEKTIHVMLAGDGAEAFALREGFAPRELLTPAANAAWEQWRADPARLDADHFRGWIPPRNVEEAGPDRARSAPGAGSHDTVCILARDSSGELAGACSTSGMAFKVPGRVGDSPIIGHGLYVDNEAGAAAATGTGELVMGVCGSFLAVELMRQGRMPLEAACAVLHRIAARFQLSPDHQVAMVLLRKDGAWASAALRPGFSHCITEAGVMRVGSALSTILA
jgi:isoaspartyl peptidase/L-asparaginase-like protein (Ntn-hydrolase superfamily)